MAIDSITPATSESASETSGSDGESRPAGDGKKVKTTEPRVVSRGLKRLLKKASPDYLTLSLTPSCPGAAAAYRRLELQSLADVDAPRDYLSLSLTPKRRESRDVSSGSRDASSSVASSSGATEGALVVVQAMHSPPPPVQKCLQPKKQKVAAAGVYQGTSASSSAGCLALVIASPHDGVSPSSCPPPIDAVPLQAVCVRGGVLHQFRFDSGATGKITTHKTAASAPPEEPAWIRDTLGLAADHQLIFIADKHVHCSDVNTQQCRFMLPRAEINDRLLPLLTDAERRAANQHEAWERPKPRPSGSGEHDGVRQRVQGKEHGGLAVTVVVNRDGLMMDAVLTRWDSSGSTVLKFRNAKGKGFIHDSGLTEDDRVQIWAFQQHGTLHLVIDKIDGGEMTAAMTTAGGNQVA